MEDVLGFKFTLDLSDLDQAPERIGEVLQKVADKAKKEGKDVDTEIKNFLESFTADYKQQADELQSAVDAMKVEREKLNKSLKETNMGTDEWDKLFDTLSAKDDALSDMEEKLDPIKNGLQEIADTSQLIQEWSQQYNMSLADAGKELQEIHDEAMQELETERLWEEATEGIKERYSDIKNSIADKVEATKEWVKSLFKAKEATEEVENAQEKKGGFISRMMEGAKSADLYGTAMKKLPAPIASVIQSNKLLNTSLKALLANPIVAVIAGIVLAIMGLTKAFKALGEYADWLSERFDSVAYVFGTVTTAVDKFIECIKAVFSLDWKSLEYNFKTMFDGGAREIEKRNEKILQAQEAYQEKLRNIENHWLRRRRSNHAIDLEERLKAEQKYTTNIVKNEQDKQRQLEAKYKIWADKVALYDARLNPNGTKTLVSDLSKDEQAEYYAFMGQFKEIQQRVQMALAEGGDYTMRLVEEQEKQKKKIADYQRSVREQLEAENRRLKDLNNQNENRGLQSQIDDMAEGIEKSAKQAELKSKQALEALDNTLYNEARKLWEDEKKIYEGDPNNEGKQYKSFKFNEYIDKARQNIDYVGQTDKIAKDEEKAVKSAIDKQLKQYEDYADKRLQIEQKAQETRLALEKAGLADSEKAKKAELDRIKQLYEVDMKEFKEGEFVKTALDNISQLSQDSLDMLEKELNNFELKEALGGVYSKEVQDGFDALRQKIEDAREPAKSLADAIEESKDAQKALTKAQEEGDPEKIVKAELKLAKANETVAKKQSEVKDAIQECANAIAELGTHINGVVGEIMQLVPNVVGIVSGVGQAMKVVTTETVASLKAIETASIILEIISLVVQLGEAIAQIFQSRKAEQKQTEEWHQSIVDIYKSVTSAVYSYRQALIDAKYANEELWGQTNIGNMTKTLEQLNEAEKRYKKLAELGTQQRTLQGVYEGTDLYRQLIENGATASNKRRVKGSGIGLSIYDMTGSYYNTLETGYQDLNHRGVLLKEVLEGKEMDQVFDEFGKFNLKAYKALKEQATEAWNGLAEVDRKQLDELAEVAEEYEEYITKLKEEMAEWFSPVLDNMTDAWMNWLQTGEDVMDSFKEYSSDTFNAIIKDILKKKLYDNLFSQYNKEIEDLTNKYVDDDNLEEYQKGIATATKDVMNKMEENSKVYEDILTAYAEELKSVADIDITGDKTKSSEARGIARASQESVDENNARLAMMQQHTYTINNNVQSLVTMSATALEHIAGIHNDTARLAKIEKSLANIETYGIKTK